MLQGTTSPGLTPLKTPVGLPHFSVLKGRAQAGVRIPHLPSEGAVNWGGWSGRQSTAGPHLSVPDKPRSGSSKIFSRIQLCRKIYWDWKAKADSNVEHRSTQTACRVAVASWGCPTFVPQRPWLLQPPSPRIPPLGLSVCPEGQYWHLVPTRRTGNISGASDTVWVRSCLQRD